MAISSKTLTLFGCFALLCCFCGLVSVSVTFAEDELPELRLPVKLQPKASKVVAPSKSQPKAEAKSSAAALYQTPSPAAVVTSTPAKVPYYTQIQALKHKPKAFIENLKTGLPALTEAQDSAYPPVGKVLVLPIMKLGEQKAFRDVGLLVAEQLGVQLKQALPALQAYSPQELLTLLQQNGQLSLYQRFAEGYTLSGQPNPVLVDKMVDMLEAKQPSKSEPSQGLERLVVLESNLDFTRPTQPGTKIEWFRKWTADSLPQTGHAFLETRLRVFELKNGIYQQVWADVKSQSVALEPMGGMSLSVKDNLQAQHLLTTASVALSKRFYEAAPITFLYDYSSQSSVTAELEASSQAKEQAQALTPSSF
jgi:hypothetical protein